MKQLLTSIILICTLLVLLADLSAQGNWTPKTALPTGPRERAFHFTIGDRMYVGGGRSFPGGDFGGAINASDVWSYHFATDTWEELSPFPGPPFRNAVSFVIDGIAYIATGHDGSDYIDPFWKYDPSTDIWEELAPFPGGPMSFPVAFALEGKGYVTLGGIGADQPDRTFYSTTLWEYDPTTNAWTEKSEFPGEGRWRGFAFVIDGLAYVGGGDRENRMNYDFSGLEFTDCYRYDPGADQWTPIADFPEGFGMGCYAFSMNGKGYVGEGGQHQYLADYRTKVWEYDPLTDNWTHVSDTPGPQFGRIKSFSGTYNGKAYVGGGRNNTTFAHMFGDFYEWDPAGPPTVPDYEFWDDLGRGDFDSAQFSVHTLQVVDTDTLWALPAAVPSVSGAPLEMMFTQDGGTTWQTSTIDPTASFVSANVFALDGRQAWVAGSLVGGQTFIYRTVDSGQSWTQVLAENENTIGIVTGLHFFNDQTGLCWGNDVSLFQGGSITVYRTTDGGVTWQQVTDPSLPLPQTGQSGFNFSGNSTYDAVGDTIWIPALSGVFRSTDQGASWTATPPGTFPAWPFSLAFADGQRGMLVSDNLPGGPIDARAFVTEDGGVTWTEIDLPEPPVGTALEYIPGTDGAFLAFGARFPGPRLSYTPNFGADWYVFEAPPVIGTVQFLAENTGFAGGPLLKNTAEGVYRWDGNFTEIIERGRLYVDADATGANDGSSWADAFTHLQDALAAARIADTIWVAAGTYYTDPARMDTTVTFAIDKNLALYGGFAGTEAHLNERDLSSQTTILSGDLGGDDVASNFHFNRADNALHVLVVESAVTDRAIIDGFTVQGGHANGGADVFGGGAWIEGAPQLSNCSFVDNYSVDDGGGVFVQGARADGIVFTQCQFLNNVSGDKGGGVAVHELVTAGAAFSDCSFAENRAVFGGGAYFLNAEVAVARSAVRSNQANFQGGGIRALYVEGGILSAPGLGLTIDSCTIEDNSATLGGGIYFNGTGTENHFSLTRSEVTENAVEERVPDILPLGGGLFIKTDQGAADCRISIDDCEVQGNESSLASGGVETALLGPDTHVTFTNSTFQGNRAPNFGGGLRVVLVETAANSSVELANCTIGQNSVELGGAGIHCYAEAPQFQFRVADCTFAENLIQNDGQGFYNGGGINLLLAGEDQLVSIERSEFVGNASSGLGGGIAMAAYEGLQRFSFLVDSCTFDQNTSTSAGGGLTLDLFGLVEAGDFRVLNSVFRSNSAAIFAGGMGIGSSGPTVPDEVVTIRDCQFIENQSGQVGGGLGCSLDDNLQLFVSDCLFEANEAAARGGGMYLNGTAPSTFVSTLSHSVFERNQGVTGAAVAVDNQLSVVGNTGLPVNARFRIEHTLMTDNSGDNGTISGQALENLSLINNTIANNMADGIRLGDDGGVELQNNILYNPGYTEFTLAAADVPVTSGGGNLLDDSSLNAFAVESDLLATDPLFLAGDSYQLSEASPAVDAGVLPDSVPEFDLAGNPRVQGNGIDIGALESSFVVATKERVVENSALSLFPNPVRDELNIVVVNSWRGALQLKVFNSLGQTLLQQSLIKGVERLDHQMLVADLPAGTYYLTVSNGMERVYQSFMVGQRP